MNLDWLLSEVVFQLMARCYGDNRGWCAARPCGKHRVGSRSALGCRQCIDDREQFASAFWLDSPLFVAAMRAALRPGEARCDG